MIEAVVLDLDGTLLTDDHIITNLNKEVLQKLIDKRVKVFLATGRSFNAMKRYHEELKLSTPAICYNGAKIIYKNGDILEFPLEKKSLDVLTRLGRKYNTHLNYYNNEVLYAEDTSREEAKLYTDISGLVPVQTDYDNLDFSTSTKALYVGDNEVLLRIEKEIKDELGDGVYTTFSKPFFLEVLHGDVNKGSAMKRIMKEENIDITKVIAFGDALNDLEMLISAGIGVAMENAFVEVKNKTKYSTLSNNNSGIGEYLKKYL
ncbi:MAG: HAD family phosphatase [Psychrilyobacter sp.]|nr:HAD family phosphatase [Psychrilyobacter sp.]